MPAKFFRAVHTAQTFIGLFREILRMEVKLHLPLDQYDHGDQKQAALEKMPRHRHGRKHHREIPVVYPTGRAAPVLHHPRLEGTEEQDADNIADEV